MKTKEEIIIQANSVIENRPFNEEGKKDNNFNYIHQEHVHELINQAYKAGFESFRVKAEEGVKKQNNYCWQSDGMEENSKIDAPIEDRFILRGEVLTTIREIKQ